MKMYVVVGLGRFGQSIAHRLCELGNEVLAIDKIQSWSSRFPIS